MMSLVWSDPAIEEFQSIIEYWDRKTQTEKYSNRIIENTDTILNFVLENPQLGVKTKIDSIRMRLILDNFYVFYQIRSEIILIVKFWDTRQNPNKIDFL